ncbi:MAG: adenylate/guanylate cyclase domain-containing protein [Spirochaetes bacterium]|nr:adenylate/guanylate cyclase domain-containing protein [Spirochaetota bacterium]
MKKKRQSINSDQISNLYIQNNITEQNHLAEIFVIRIYLILIPILLSALPLAYFLFYWLAKGSFQPFYLVLIGYLIVVIIYHQIIYRKLKKGLKSIVVKFINVGIEISTVSIVFLVLIQTFNVDTIFTGPIIMVYLIMIMMTGFRYSLRLSLFAGIMGGFQHLVIYLLFYQKLSPDLINRLIDLGFSGMWQKTFYLLIGGVISGLLAVNTKKLITKIANKSLEAQKVKIAFGQYVSKEIRDSILNGKIELGGEEKNGVILFSDIRNFTSMLEQYQPKEVINQLNEYFTAMVEVIASNHGVVNKFIGDAIMSVFGLFNEHENAEYIAVKTAIQMQKRLEELNKEWTKNNLLVLKMGIGISSGTFLTGNVGSEDRKEFTCIGDVVNTASRLECLTKKLKKSIIISEEVNIRLKETHDIKTVYLDSIALKGKSHKEKIYHVQQKEN